MKSKSIQKYVLIALTGVLFSFINGDLVHTKISSHVSMDIHKEMSLIPANQSYSGKYLSAITPMAVYETTDQEVKLIVRLIKEAVDSTSRKVFKNPEAANKTKDLGIEKMFKKSALMAQFDEITFYQDTVKTINGNDFMVFEYTAKSSGVNAKGEETTSEAYAYYQVCYTKNKTYIFNFYCPEEMREDWQENTGLMMNSLKIRK